MKDEKKSRGISILPWLELGTKQGWVARQLRASGVACIAHKDILEGVGSVCFFWEGWKGWIRLEAVFDGSELSFFFLSVCFFFLVLVFGCS